MSGSSGDPSSTVNGPRSMSPGMRLMRWTTNLLASGLVLIAGLAAGREVLVWWHATPDSSAAVPAAQTMQPPEFDFERGFVDLRFGAAPLVVRREVVVGAQAAALDTLRRNSIALAQQMLASEHQRPDAAAADHLLGSDDSQAARALTGRLAGLQPVAQEPGRWALYEWTAPLPANVVVAADTSRVLAWGLAFPQAQAARDEATWSLFSWVERGRRAGTSSGPTGSQAADLAMEGEVREPPRPAGTTLGMCLASRDAAALATFQARGGTAWIERHYDAWTAQAGGQVEMAWQSTGHLRSARYRLADGARLLVQLDSRDPDRVLGIVTQWPPRAGK